MKNIVMTLSILLYTMSTLQAQTDTLNQFTQYMKQELNLAEDQVLKVDEINVKYEKERKSIMNFR